MKQRYYFFTADTFTEGQFDTDKEAIDSKDGNVIRVMRAKDSMDVWKKEEDKPE